MNLSELLAGLRRRWWLVALGLLATVALSVGAAVLVPSQQEIHATILVLPPQPATPVGAQPASTATVPTAAPAVGQVDEPTNPYLALAGLEPAADVLARAMTGGAVQQDLTPAGSTAQFDVARDDSMAGPALLVTATDRTATKATTLLDAVITRMPEVFADLQKEAGVLPSATLSLQEVSRETKPIVDTKSQVRAVLVAAVGGLVLTVLVTYLVDGLVLRRNALKEARQQEDAGSDDAGPTTGAKRTHPRPKSQNRRGAPERKASQPRVIRSKPHPAVEPVTETEPSRATSATWQPVPLEPQGSRVTQAVRTQGHGPEPDADDVAL